MLAAGRPTERPGPSPGIDLLFASLAEHWGPKSIAVVLSGTGSDGAEGLRSVRNAGGLTLVQSPDAAGFDGMPRGACGGHSPTSSPVPESSPVASPPG